MRTLLRRCAWAAAAAAPGAIGGGGGGPATSTCDETQAARPAPGAVRRETRAGWMAESLGPPRVHRIVVTGGPCAGKTTAMTKLASRLGDMGFAVYVVPELATLTITGGAAPAAMARPELVAWETAILRAQMRLEDTFVEIAERCSATQHSVLLCDRGTMDVLAYLGKETFQDVLADNGWSVPALRDARYNAVVHLVSAAIGAEKFYTLENNKARMESPEEAAALDHRLSRAWVGHNSLHIIENSGSFEDKMVRATAAVCEALGVPGPRAVPRWWIVEQKGPVDVEHAEWHLEHIFLAAAAKGVESRVTKKSCGNAVTYHHRVSGAMVDGELSVSERTISYREYKGLAAAEDTERTRIKKTRRAFIWENEYYMLDSFEYPPATKGMLTLFVEKPIQNGTVSTVPPFLRLVEDVTQKQWFNTHAHDSWKRTMAIVDDVQNKAVEKALEEAADKAADGKR
ncbi:AAA domain-containing protein [Pelagophyceae sp. CCMP2097]|nr:AAA domain-containing protein [Pelagophyceae sp. CCMP2097]